MALTIYINNSIVDTARSGSGATWIAIDPVADYFVFSNGSDAVKNDVTIPDATAKNRAAVLLTGSEQTVPKYFLADITAGVLKEIFLAGSEDAQYVFCFAFNAATATEPVLEMWDDNGIDTTAIEVLGAGTPDDSWYKAICTTTTTSLSAWTGFPLAGSTAGHFISLNDGSGALAKAKDLYMQFKIVIPASASYSGTASPIMVVKYTSN